MDSETLIAEVAKRHGILLGRNDPVLLLGTVAEMMMAEARTEIKELLKEATNQIAASSGLQMDASKETAEKIVTGSGSWVATQIRTSMAECQERLLELVRAERDSAAQSSTRAVWAAMIASGAALLVVGGLAGYLIAGAI